MAKNSTKVDAEVLLGHIRCGGSLRFPKIGQKWSKMVKNGQKSHFSPHPLGNILKIKKNVKKVAGIVGIDLTNSNLMLLGHIWYR